MEVSWWKKKIGLNTSTKWGQTHPLLETMVWVRFSTHTKKKVDSVGLVEASLELGVSSEGFVKTREGGGVSLHTLEDGGEE